MNSATLFESVRPRLWGLAYRMLGSAADADDAVQDTFLRWQAATQSDIDNPEGWLTSTCTRRCIDLLRSARYQRETYIGPWLPEPVLTDPSDQPDQALVLGEDLSVAFLLMLERLTPAERAAYLLRDIFDHDYDAIAAMLQRQPAACRQLVSRARRQIGRDQVRQAVTRDQQQRLLNRFLDAIQTGEDTPLAALLAEDAVLVSDGGGKVIAARKAVRGRMRIVKFLGKVGAKWRQAHVQTAWINGSPGLLMRSPTGLEAVLHCAWQNDGRIARLFVVRNPDKLTLPAVPVP